MARQVTVRLVLAAAFAMRGMAAPTPSVSTSITSQETCITRMRFGSGSMEDLPTSTRTLDTTQTQIVTVTGQGQSTTELFTPSAVTSTSTVKVTKSAASSESQSLTTSTSTSTFLVTETQPAGSSTAAACTATTRVKANATTTVYTGTYNSPVSKRTAGPVPAPVKQVRHGVVAENRLKLSGNALVHKIGTKVMSNLRRAFEVDCMERVTTYLIQTTTLAGETTTITQTAATPTSWTTETQTTTVGGAAASSAASTTILSIVTVTSTITTTTSAATSTANICTITTGKATATTTQHIKCAPTNLIGTVHGYGIGEVQGSSDNETQGLTDGYDASACCQTCVDTDDCAASEDDPGAGNCFLWYTSAPTCGLAFAYTDDGLELAPGAGFLVQTGCGTIEVGENVVVPSS